MNILRLHLHFAPKSVKVKAYLETVRPLVEYSSACWSPSSQLLSHQLEMIQHSAAKFATNCYPRKESSNDFSVSSLLESLGWESLETRREQARLTMAFKILNDLVILDKDALQRKHRDRPSRACSDVLVGPLHQLEEPIARVTSVQNTFFYAVPKLWNNKVKPEQAAATSVLSFKRYFTSSKHKVVSYPNA